MSSNARGIYTAKAFSANPQELTIDIYQALQTGLDDGQDNPPTNIWDFKMHEVSKYLTVTNYAAGQITLSLTLMVQYAYT